jgi:hypothetical protein
MNQRPRTGSEHAELLAAYAARGADAEGRPGAVAAVNARLWRRGAVPRSLYQNPARELWLTAVNDVLRERGLVQAADHEFHTAPEGGLPDAPSAAGDPAGRPDPWTWAIPHAVSKARCGGAVHRVVFDRGAITHPDHPGGTWQTAACHRSPHLKAVTDAPEAAGPLAYFTPTYFTDLGMEKVPFNWEMCWGSQPEVYPDPGDDRYCQRYAATLYDDDLREAVFPAVDAVTVHDPLRPELTAVTVRRVPGLPDTAWWSGPGTLRMEVCLSAW